MLKSLQLQVGEYCEPPWPAEPWRIEKCMWYEGQPPTHSLGCGKIFLQLREGSPNSENLISFFCQRASNKILGSITVIITVGGKNDLIVNQWPHPNNHVLIISKESCLHSCLLSNETDDIGRWLYSLAMIPWKQWEFAFTLHLTQTTKTAVQPRAKCRWTLCWDNV